MSEPSSIQHNEENESTTYINMAELTQGMTNDEANALVEATVKKFLNAPSKPNLCLQFEKITLHININR